VQRDRRLLDMEYNGVTPLYSAAAAAGQAAVVGCLLDQGADMDLVSEGSPSALEAACTHGRVEVVALLLAPGAEAEPDGSTPPMFAAWGGHTDVMGLLLAHGGSYVDHQGSEGR
jgi:ankyrin repeat protein